ncbi:MAG: PQQ-binding-like beta-propeller repeat protein [Deltaproteobacteria bacterium]|nr:PQQ-binding-like beta-propeller repeat protein [Deltaproteobacteria bacterium]
MSLLRLVPPSSRAGRYACAAAALAPNAEPSAPAQGELQPEVAAVLRLLFEDHGRLAALGRSAVTCLLREIAFALVDLSLAEGRRAVVPIELRGNVWEIGLTRDGAELLVSLFMSGAQPRVIQTELRVPMGVAREVLLDALRSAGSADPGLAMAGRRLADAASCPSGTAAARRQRVDVRGARRAVLRIEAVFELRTDDRPGGVRSEVARADLHALLFQGRMRFAVGRSVRELAQAHVFLVAEQLVALVTAALEAQLAGRGMLRRVCAGGTSLGVQLDPSGRAALLVGERSGDEAHGSRLPAVALADLVQGALAFSGSLGRELLRADPALATNLRLSALREAAEALGERAGGTAARGAQLNEAPESYRAFAASAPENASRPATSGAVGRLRFTESWRATVSGIDLRSIFLCGERLVVGSSRELCCVERSSGALLWRRRASRGVSILTPSGLVRLGPDGRFVLHGLDDGEPRLELGLAPAVGATASGAVVSARGLPRLVLLAEGARELCAVDLDSAEVRWRRPVRSGGGPPGPLRLRRAGKLVVVASAEPALAALDLMSGEVLWRHAGPLCYPHGVAVDGGELYALGMKGPGPTIAAALRRIDPWSGAVVWSSDLRRPVSPTGAPQVCGDGVLVTTRERGRLGLMCFERDTGVLRFELDGVCEGEAACLVVDDALIANGELGELVAVAASSGEVLYRHVFAAHCAGDRPRSLQPLLRSGAIFLPQSEIYVLRPRDGALLGKVPSDLIPDSLHVDERCGVYVAELSGYLAAYAALPALTLVSPA